MLKIFIDSFCLRWDSSNQLHPWNAIWKLKCFTFGRRDTQLQNLRFPMRKLWIYTPSPFQQICWKSAAKVWDSNSVQSLVMVTKIAAVYQFDLPKGRKFWFNPELFGDCFCQEPMWDSFLKKKRNLRDAYIIIWSFTAPETPNFEPLPPHAVPPDGFLPLPSLDWMASMVGRRVHMNPNVKRKHMRDIPLHKQNDCSIIYGTSPNLLNTTWKAEKSKAFICVADFTCFAPHYISPLHPIHMGLQGLL